MSSESSRRADASTLTDGELHLLAERHPELSGHSVGVTLGSRDEKSVKLIEALATALGTGSKIKASHFGIAVLSKGERVLLAERRPQFESHGFDVVAATSDSDVARVLDALVDLFSDEEKTERASAAKGGIKEAPKSIAKDVPKDIVKDPLKDIPKEALKEPVAVEEKPSGDRAPWAAALPDSNGR